MIITSDTDLTTTLTNLTSFGRYIVSIIACQNFTEDLLDYASTLSEHQEKILFVQHLKHFSIAKYCSKPALITLRSLPDRSKDQVVESSLIVQSGVFYFQWSAPKTPNGFIFKYNLKFIDTSLNNKTQGPLCFSELANLKVALNQFLLTEGHEYLIQVQAVSSAGPGLWSMSDVIYKVPNISRQNIVLIVEIMGMVFTTLLVVCVALIRLK